MRIEKLADAMPFYERGYAVLHYWNVPKGKHTCDAEFKIHEDQVKTGHLAWAPHTGDGTTGLPS